MEEYIFLIQNGDLYNLGYTKNLEKIQDSLSPGKLFAYMKTKKAESICKSLQLRYINERIPMSDYFRLKSTNKSQKKSISAPKSDNSGFSANLPKLGFL